MIVSDVIANSWTCDYSLDPETGPQALPALFLCLLLGLLLSDFQSTKAFSFQNRLSLNFAYRLNTIFYTIAPFLLDFQLKS